jgi:23S rRNA (guanosine2251-2'-O)-methyltransferase
MKLKPEHLRHNSPSREELEKIKRIPLYFVLDNVLDTYNIGSMFRLADAVSAEMIYLCGETESPPNSRIHKAAVGTENWVKWKHTKTTSEAINELKSNGVRIIAVEQDSRSISYKDINPSLPVAIVLGHETKGVDPEILSMADEIIELPMLGINSSLNVWGTAAVVAYKILETNH